MSADQAGSARRVFSASQLRVIGGCALAYTLAYLNRLNLSAALRGMMEALGLSAASAGMLQTCFAIAYAAGQLINGMLSDRSRPSRMILLGLTGTALCNIALGLSRAYPLLLGLCLLNGVFQSMLWTPIVRLVALSCQEEQPRKRANLLLSVTLVLGHFAAWAVSGALTLRGGWWLSFLVPGLATLPMILVVFRLLRRFQGEAGLASPERAARDPLRRSLSVLAGTGFFLMLVGCVFYGFTRDSMITWAPDLLNSLNGGGLSSYLFSLVIPLVNLTGILFGFYVRYHGGKDSRGTLIRLLPLVACFCALLLITKSLPLTALWLGLSCAVLYGLTPILTTLIPMEYDRYHCVGLAAGLVDSSIYVGSALSGVAGGFLYGQFGAQALYGALIAATLCAVAMFGRSLSNADA